MMAAVEETQKVGPPPRKLPRDTRRMQLIEATIDTIAMRGYSRTTLSEVARQAGLSHGLLNFHFETKEKLLLETLLYLAEEYRTNWTQALAAAGPAAPAQIDALIGADFRPAICTPARLSAWCAFWGEGQSRPIYQEYCSANDDDYNHTLEVLCARMNAEHGYDNDAIRTARVLRVTVEGIWLDMMTMNPAYSLSEAKASALTCVTAFFPRHFGMSGLLL